jgi:hypothetical protein
MRIRPGGPGDIAAVLALGDEAVTWMNARGNTQQWGTAPWTGSQQREAVIRDLAHGGGMRIAEDPDGRVLGALVITGTPQPYVPAAAEPELYVNLIRLLAGPGVYGHAADRGVAGNAARHAAGSAVTWFTFSGAAG